MPGMPLLSFQNPGGVGILGMPRRGRLQCVGQRWGAGGYGPAGYHKSAGESRTLGRLMSCIAAGRGMGVVVGSIKSRGPAAILFGTALQPRAVGSRAHAATDNLGDLRYGSRRKGDSVAGLPAASYNGLRQWEQSALERLPSVTRPSITSAPRSNLIRRCRGLLPL